MTQREKEILTILKSEPTISQQDLADRLGITRSSVAVHITNLLKKGYILGKGYIVQEDPYIVVIGGANIDIQGVPKKKLTYRDSNIGEVKVSLGGVGRNIAENCARLNITTRLISVIGDDLYGQQMLKHAQSIGLHMQDCVILPQTSTSTYLSILDESHDLAVSINHMDTIEFLTVENLKAKRSLIEHAQLCVLDTNLSESVLKFLLTSFPNTIFFVDPVSGTKALKLQPYLQRIHTLKPNLLEAKMLSSIEENLPSLDVLAKSLKAQRVFISLGSQGVYVLEGRRHIHLQSPPVDVINATGAGDAFMAGLVYAYLKGMNIEDTAWIAMGASRLALSHIDTINPNLCEELLLKTTEEIRNV
ncbi:MAG: winged helix-turn-helix transcriptional regulator [Erysipelothrix sp.]|nr:winged helix-turn-helix transcriptional regulator [Erysipelothrix sp.]